MRSSYRGQRSHIFRVWKEVCIFNFVVTVGALKTWWFPKLHEDANEITRVNSKACVLSVEQKKEDLLSTNDSVYAKLWKFLVIVCSISYGKFTMRSGWTAATDAEYSQAWPQVQPEEIFSVSFHSPKDTAWKQPLPPRFLPRPVGAVLERGWWREGSPRGSAHLATLLVAGAEFPAPWICVSGCDGGGGGRISLCLAAWRALLRSTLRVRCYDSYYHNKCLSAEEGAYSSVRHNYHPRFTRLKTYVKIWVRWLGFRCVYGGLGVNLVERTPADRDKDFWALEWGDKERTGQNLEERSLVWKECSTNEETNKRNGWDLAPMIESGREGACRSWFLEPMRLQVCSGSQSDLFLYFLVQWSLKARSQVHGEMRKTWMMWWVFDKTQYILSKYIQNITFDKINPWQLPFLKSCFFTKSQCLSTKCSLTVRHEAMFIKGMK